MTSENTAWFEKNRPEVEGFEFPDCPHGVLRLTMEHSRTDRSYICERCGLTMVAKIIEED